MTNELTSSTPGRICLFGEHQDYLGLPVVPAAISLRLNIHGTPRTDRRIHIELPDICSREEFSLDDAHVYTKTNDYFRSVVRVLQRHGFTFTHGVDCVLQSRIPLQAGTSSSSALVVGWVNFLAQMSEQRQLLPPELLARYAHEAEVTEFSEAGGMMDQFSTAYGGVVAIDFVPTVKVEKLIVTLGTFVLGDSAEPKDTQAILKRVKEGVLKIVDRIAAADATFSLVKMRSTNLERYKRQLGDEEYRLLGGTVQNHEFTQQARALLAGENHRDIGKLLTEHQTILRDVLRISTPKIDRMLDAAMGAGAYGGKINGSGGGGCMFAYAPERSEHVAEAIERAGGRAYIVSIDEGSKVIGHG
ncbi:MAG: GHMP kinase [Ignavibacteriae bacterium]|nr:GHMP kinase [Ignavibacteriota bacterium]